MEAVPMFGSDLSKEEWMEGLEMRNFFATAIRGHSINTSLKTISYGKFANPPNPPNPYIVSSVSTTAPHQSSYR